MADVVDGAAQRRVETETREAGQERGHDSPAGGTARPTEAGARLVGAVSLIAGVILEAVIEDAADTAHARHHVHHRPRSTQRRRLLGGRAVGAPAPATAPAHHAPAATTHAAAVIQLVCGRRRVVGTGAGRRSDTRQQSTYLDRQATTVTPPRRVGRVTTPRRCRRPAWRRNHGRGGRRRLAGHSAPASAAGGGVGESGGGRRSVDVLVAGALNDETVHRESTGQRGSVGERPAR